MNDQNACPACAGNDHTAPCAYPSEGRPGCLRDARLAKERKARLKRLSPEQYEENLLQHGVVR